MKYIRKYINKKELKEILNNEIFEKISINKNKSNLFDFYASENWIYVNRLYIPKAMILNVYSYNNLIYIYLLNNKKDTIINYTMKDNDKFCDELIVSKIIPNIYFSKNIVSYHEFEKKYIKKFLNEIINKEDFLNLIKKNYFFTKKELKKDFLKENLIKEKKEYFKEDNGKLYEKHTNSLGEIFIYEVDNYYEIENNTYFDNKK
nr:hypothetical protein [uncultured Tyzzerella sp.]